MDGFPGMMDARASFGDRERKLETLKGLHVGSSATLGATVYVLSYLGILVELPIAPLSVVSDVHVLVEAMSGLSVIWSPKTKNSGLMVTFSEGAQKETIAVAMFFFMATSLCLISWTVSAAVGTLYTLAALAVYIYCYRTSIKKFGGITGDLAGYFLQTYELVLITALAVSLQV